METIAFHSKGKFLLSGEYFVLKGAKALAIPLRLGQSLVISQSKDEEFIKWSTYVKRDKWFWVNFNNALEIKESSDVNKALSLQAILRAAKKINPSFLSKDENLDVKSYIDFDINWGLGSSSSLISNIAYWAKVDPFTLHFAVSNGSGYDIACARSNFPLMYQQQHQKAEFREILFNPDFKSHLSFVYTGRKQDSKNSVIHFNKNAKIEDKTIATISNISEEMIQCRSLDTFMTLMGEHEQIVAETLGEATVKQKSFPDFNGEIKSMGAWGGDFLLVASRDSFEQTQAYFKKKGLEVVIRFRDIVFE
ncbi:MAG: hypothetical protein JEZ03_03945 [Bacteroidales bacterium]|nr:hypothetical protein [Bacteroidales bacterium]